MCFDYEFTCAAWEETFPRARKEYKCCECGSVIPAGTGHLKVFFIGDDGRHSLRACPECQVWRCKIALVEIEHGCLDGYWTPFPGLHDEISQSAEYRALEPTADDLSVSLEEWMKRVTAAPRAAREQMAGR